MSSKSTFAKKTILITGAAGFIGSHISRALSASKSNLVLVDQAPVEIKGATAAKVEVLNLDICTGAFIKLLKQRQFDFLFHFAGNANVLTSVQAPLMDFQTNAAATVAMLDTLRTTSVETKFIFASTASVYGNPKKLPIAEEDHTVPISPYGAGKLAVERYLDVYAKLYGLRSVSLRMFSPFGPGLRKQIVYDLARKLLRDPPRIEVLGDGSQTRDFIYADDLVSAILCIVANADFNGEVYNIGTGQETSVSAIVTQLVSLIGHNTEVTYTGRQNEGYAERWRADISKLASLGWSAETSLSRGLELTVEWIAREDSQR